MTIIGFVKRTEIEAVLGEKYCLPIGFAKDGSKKTKQWEKCTLILVDDNGNCEIPCCGNNTDAILVQHRSSSKEKRKNQRTRVISCSWELKGGEPFTFSHEAGDSFWEGIQQLVQGDEKKRAEIIKSLIDMYRPAEAFRALDIEAAHKIISAMKNPESLTTLQNDLDDLSSKANALFF